jgi:hypothetical protein
LPVSRRWRSSASWMCCCARLKASGTSSPVLLRIVRHCAA